MKLKWFTYFVMFYLLVASSWWTLLLFNKNKAQFDANIELANLSDNYSLEETEKEFKRQKAMIFGEGLFLGVTLIAGIWLIYRGNRKEINAINRQNNFLLAITHELKSPLSSIDLILQTIKKRDLDKTQLEELTSTGTEEVKRLEDMVQNLLLSSNEHKTSDPIFREVAIDQIILDILLSFRKRYPQSEISYHNYTTKSITLNADKDLLSIAIKNIVDNAHKYGDNKKIDIHLNRINNEIIIHIKDHGKGINTKDKKLIFNRFFRAGNEWTRDFKGTGIGLYISKKIIQAHHGNIIVTDNIPQGSIFTITMPCNE